MTTGTASGDALLQVVRRALGDKPPVGLRACVALSGGMDSVVLLHALVQLRAERGFTLTAIHVHHGLSANADAWAAFCERLCQQWDVSCEIAHLKLPDARGKGIERVAREGRYAAFACAPGDVICLAHHQNDRAETFLLNLFRGAGTIGLSAVPARRMLGQKTLLRPLIDTPRSVLQAWAETHHLTWIEDESNADIRFRRNFLRHRVLPVIADAYPGVVGVLSRTADAMLEQTALLDRLADLEGTPCRDTTGCLSVVRLQALSELTVRNILRFALCNAGARIPSAGRLMALSAQLMSHRPDAETFVSMGTVGIHIWRDQLWLDVALDRPLPPSYEAVPGVTDWPDGQLSLTTCVSGSLGPLTLQARALGQGQRFRPAGRCRDSVSELLRAQGVPPWIRPRLPGLWSGTELLWAAGLGWADAGDGKVIPQGCRVIWDARDPKRL